jgi:acetyl-CoA acetyltransferase
MRWQRQIGIELAPDAENPEADRSRGGRCVQSTTGGLAKLVIVFDDQSTMTVKTAGVAVTASTGAKVKAVLENGDQCTLQLEDGSSITTCRSRCIRCGA